MKTLPNVTLISYDNTDRPERTLRALNYCASLIQFAAVVLVARVQPENANGTTVRLVNQAGYESAMMFEVRDIVWHVDTDFALYASHDGYIMNPEAWRDDWLEFDFIGAPWPMRPTETPLFHPGAGAFRVGNTGFCLKSVKFMRLTHDFAFAFPSWEAGDVFCCQTMRTELEQRGVKFAPVSVAADFAWECNIEEFPDGRPDAFGFHNFNGKAVPKI